MTTSGYIDITREDSKMTNITVSPFVTWTSNMTAADNGTSVATSTTSFYANITSTTNDTSTAYTSTGPVDWTSPATNGTETSTLELSTQHTILDDATTTSITTMMTNAETTTTTTAPPTTTIGTTVTEVATTLATTVITESSGILRDVIGAGDYDGETSTDAQQHTRSGIPVSYIWVPYVIFSMVLVGLMIGSFVRFHKKNGHKYKRRRAELWRQLNMQNILNQVVGTATSPPNGGVAAAPRDDGRAAKPSTSKPAGARKSRRPLVFNSNLNGSMVDVRCGLSESLSTFRTRPPAQSLAHTRSSGPPRQTGLFSASKSHPAPEDEVFLLQQTRL